MNTVPHDFVTVDMRGLKAALVARAREQRVSVSVVVRDAVARVLPLNQEAAAMLEASSAPVDMGVSSGTVKVSCVFRTKSASDSDPNPPPFPIQKRHPFRFKTATVSDPVPPLVTWAAAQHQP